MFRQFFIFLTLCAVVLLKIHANPTYYLTPDSYFYLQGAQNLLEGNGYRINLHGHETYCAIWPLGYSSLIAAWSFLTTLSPSTSAKFLNLLAVAGCFVLFWKPFRQRAYWVSLIFFNPTLIQVISNTWSEPVFFFALIGFSLALAEPATHWFPLVLWGSLLFLIRYIGGFVVFELLILIVYRKFSHRSSQRERNALAGIVLVMLLYFGYNYWQTGTFSGGHGYPPTEPYGQRIITGLWGVAEEGASLFRDWNLKEPQLPPMVFLFIVLIWIAQLVLLLRIVWQVYHHLQLVSLRSDRRTNYLLLTAGLYFLITVVLYLTDASMEDLRFRRLAPTTLLLSLGLVAWLLLPANQRLFQRVKYAVFSLFVLSILHAIPKTILIP